MCGWVKFTHNKFVKSSQNSLMACLHEQFSAYLSPDTVTGDDGRQQPETTSRRLSAEVEHVPMVAKK